MEYYWENSLLRIMGPAEYDHILLLSAKMTFSCKSYLDRLYCTAEQYNLPWMKEFVKMLDYEVEFRKGNTETAVMKPWMIVLSKAFTA